MRRPRRTAGRLPRTNPALAARNEPDGALGALGREVRGGNGTVFRAMVDRPTSRTNPARAAPNELSCRCAAPDPMKTGSGRGTLGARARPRHRPNCVWSLEAASELGRGHHAPDPGAPARGEPVGETVGGASRRPPRRGRPAAARWGGHRPSGDGRGAGERPRSVSASIRGYGGGARGGPDEFSGEPDARRAKRTQGGSGQF